MESRFNVHFLIYDDLPELARAVATVPEDVIIHVFDGRYVDFDGDHALTPGAKEFCHKRRNLEYHEPPEELVPFGDSAVPTAYRDSVHEKACWAYYDELPQDQWTIHLDTDERLIYLDRSFFERIQDDVIFSPRIFMQKDLSVRDQKTTSIISHTMRIFKPRYWTFWVDDLPIPRNQCERGLGSKKTKEVHQEVDQREFRERTQSVVIENLGERRPDEYLKRRRNQLKKFHE